MEHIEVYLHIFKAKDIKGVEKNGKSDPYIRVMIPNAKGKLQELYKTETIKNTRKPKYNLELVIRVPCGAESVVLQLRDWNAILKHKKLGVVVLPLNKFSKRANVEIHTIEGGGELKLCTRLIGACSSDPRLQSVQVLPKVRLHLEHMIYHPGEVVRGHMIFADRELVKNPQQGSVSFQLSSVFKNIQYVKMLQRLDTTQGTPRVLAFQFLIPKRIPTVHDGIRPGELNLSIFASVAGTNIGVDNTRIIIMPPFEGLEPKLSPRRQETITPHSILVTWVDIPKILYRERKYALKFILHNSGAEPAEFTGLSVTWRHQCITTELEPKMRAGLVSKESFMNICTVLENVGYTKLGPSETREFSFEIAYNEHRRLEPSAPFEISGEVYELNYFFELEIQPPAGDAIVLNRRPFFWTLESLSREATPNYQLSMDPDTFWVTAPQDKEITYPFMAPSAAEPKRYSGLLFQISDPFPTEMFSALHREKLIRVVSNEELPPLTSIFDVPFEDAS